MSAAIDPFQLEIIKNCFDTIADDMALTLMRTAHSGIVRDSLDFSTAICDAGGPDAGAGRLHADASRQLLRRHAQADQPSTQGRIGPGDVFIFNDPYAAAGQHLPDIYIATPIIHGRSDRAPGPRPSRTIPTSAASSPAATRSAPPRSSRRACACRSSSSSRRACRTRRSGT